MLTLLKKILRDLRLRPLRNGLTLLGIILGVAGVVTIAFTTRSIVDGQRLTYDANNQADFVAFGSNLNAGTVSLLERQANVEFADTRTVTLTRFTVGDEWITVRLVGISSFEEMKLDVADLVSGRFPGRDEIAFDESTRDLADIAIGDVVAIQRSISEEPVYLTISGFTRSPAVLGAGISNQAIAYTSAATVRSMRDLDEDNYLMVRFQDRNIASQSSRELTGILAKRGVQLQNASIREPGEFIGSQELNTMLLLLQVFSILGVVLSSILVANTISAIMSEETAQIGIARSLGARRWQIAWTYLLYALILGLTGAMTGLVLGVIAGRQLSEYLLSIAGLRLPPLSLQPRELMLAILVGILVTLTTTLIPAIRSANQAIAPLLRRPGVRTGYQSRIIQHLTSALAEINPSVTMGVRNASRRPARTAMTLLVVSVAVAAYVATSALSGSVNGTVDELYELYGADGWIFFQDQVHEKYVAEIEQIDNVQEAENWLTAVGSIGAVRTDLWGMPEFDPLYSYRIVEGTWLTKSNPPAVVVSNNLAGQTGIQLGDIVTIDVGNASSEVQVIGIVDDSSTYLGATTTGKVFMIDHDLQRLTGMSNLAGIFAVKLVDSDPDVVDATLLSIEVRSADLSPGSLAAYKDQESANQAINILTLLLNAMVLLVAFVGLAGIINTLLININERRREIGVLRSVGGRTIHILTILISEGVVVAAAGAVIGVVAGYPLAKLFVDLTGARLFELSFHLSFLNIGFMLLLALLAVSAVSTIPGLIAAHLRPINVLRYE